jgi:hypothetical protein
MDLRIETIFQQQMRGDTSFKDNSPSSIKEALFGVTYSNHDMRETWDSGIKHGIEIGLNVASLEGQKIELNHNTPDGKNKEFLEKFYRLAEEYKCAIKYHPRIGMVVLDRNYLTNN